MEDAPVLDRADHRVDAIRLVHAQAEFAIVQQHGLPGLDIGRELFVARPGHVGIAGALAHLDGELVAVDEFSAVLHHAHPQLWALHVGEQRRVRPELGVDGLDLLHRGGVDGMLPVGEVEADDVDPFADQALQDLGRGAGRADGGDNLGEFLRHLACV